MVINIRVRTGSQRNEIIKDTENNWRISVSTPPVDGKANSKLIELIAKDLGVAKNRVLIDHGEKSKQKTVKILD